MTSLFYGLIFMNLLFVTSAVCLLKPSTASAVATAVAAVAWILFNGPLEGQVLWSLNSQHGLTVSDLLGFAAFGIAVRGWIRVRSRREVNNSAD
ncbi:hypothetical protein [Rhodococcus sp. IEGM 1379]|uniref:hypothetical protein n=1 Tax=Rhodococcus sp. IEGM 1379 TaxID=3047086 RepID=UPI0024B7F47A|nr:hypothetical protein [Rhodococcus sp. IEGM 1379]MDI9915049.1 hypothetical protein [Rhodococcus sp. IEGM 1379]